MKFIVRLFALFVFCLTGARLSAQISSTGKTFFLSFMEMEARTGGYPDSLLIYITSEVNTTIVIDNPRIGGTSQTINITAGKVNRYSADPGFYYPQGYEKTSGNIESKRSLRIVAKDPINVYTLNLELNRSDGTFVLPYESIPLAPEFRIAAFTPTQTAGGGKYQPSEFVVVGMDNNVEVEITPTTKLASGTAAGSTFSVTLTKGQVYQVQSDPSDGNTGGNSTTGDLTGTRVRVINGCGKINVFSGMKSVRIPGATCGVAVDHLYTQVFPTKILGTKHVLMPFMSQTKGYIYRVIATKPNTKVYINGTLTSTLATAGKYYQGDITTSVATCITSDSQIYVVQYMKNGGTCAGTSGNNGDPAILIMPDQNQKMLKALVGTATTNNMNLHYVNIMVNSNSTNAVKLNGSYVSSSSFTNVACAGQAYVQIKVNNPSTNLIECDSGLIVVAYGMGQYESYSYCSGALFENLDYDFTIQRKGKCPGENVKLTAITTNPKVKGYIWNFGDGFTDTGKIVNHRFQRAGSFYVVLKVLAPGPCGSTDTISRSKIINILPGPIFNIPDTVFQCRDTLNYVFTGPVNKSFFYTWRDSSKSNVFVAKTPGKVWFKINDTASKCTLYDSSWVKQFSPVKVKFSADTANMCLPTNFFSLADNSGYTNDSFKSAKWRITRPYIANVSKRDTFSILNRFRINFDTTGVFPVKYWVFSKNGCVDSLTSSVSVYHMPTAVYNASDSEFCVKESARFVDSSFGEGGIAKSFWYFGDGASTTGTPAFHSFLTFDTFSVRLITETTYGCRDTADSSVIVHPLPKMVMAVTVNNVCKKANSFNFNDNSTLPYGTMINKWKYEKVVVNNQLILNNIKFSDTGNFKVTLYNTTEKGCMDSTNKTVYVAPEPKAIISLLDSSKCLDVNYFTFDDVSTLSKGTIASRMWYFGDGNTATTKTVTKKNYNAYGIYTVKLVVNTTTYNCKDSITRKVQVFASPLAPFDVNDSTQCLPNNKFDFTPKTVFSVSGVTATHNWDFGDGNYDIVSAPSHGFNTVGNYSVRYIIKTDQGCADTANRIMQVFANPVANFTMSKDSSCLGSYKYDFINTTTFGSGFNNKWTLGDGNTATTKDVLQKSYNFANTYNIKLVVGSAQGCNDSIVKSVHVLPVPQASFLINKKTQCLVGNDFQFTNNTNTNGASPMNYQWTFTPGSTFNTQFIANQNMPDTGSYDIELIAFSGFGCSTSIKDKIYVAENPQVQITGGNACVGDPIQFNATATVNSGSITNYSWDFGDGKTDVSEDPLHTYATANTYNVKLTVTSDKGCTATAGPIAANAYVLPVADFSWQQTETRGMETDHVFEFTGSGANQYFWTFHDGQTNTVGGPFTMTFLQQGQKTEELLVISANGCRDSIKKIIMLNPALQMWIVSSFSPNDDGLNEKFGPSTAFGLTNYSMMIYDRWGAKMFETKDPAVSWTGNDDQNEPAPEGVYVYRIVFRYVDGKIYVFKGSLTLIR
ncbi:MAG: PKD domain-containing protein [Bacteroidetes bacterium]|nr:PKD domain-containing protein [Bacteroidota bacterium]